jgi:CRISPR-associated endonuclease Cas1
MNSEDALYGRIKNGVLTLSGNNAGIRVDGGCLVVSDGPCPVAPDHVGPVAPIAQRMATHRFRRADCPINRIVVTRPDGFITFAAIKWLHGVGVGLVQLDWDGTVLLASAPAGADQPALRRAQAIAATNGVGHAVAQELLRAKLNGQAAIAGLLGSTETAKLIVDLAGELNAATNSGHLLAIEGAAAIAYWSLWLPTPLRFARRDQVPEHWQSFGRRNSPLGRRNTRNAVTPANAVLNYLYGVLASELTIALTGVGLDPGLGIFHTDAARRASLTYDAMEAVRSCVDGWLAAWLVDARFSKRDFYEGSDGTIRITRPLTSHLAMTGPVWRPAAQSVAGWLARALAGGLSEERQSQSLFSALPAPRRAWTGMQAPIPKTCIECGGALAPKQRKFCSDVCSVSFRVALGRRPTDERSSSSANPLEDDWLDQSRTVRPTHCKLRRTSDGKVSAGTPDRPPRLGVRPTYALGLVIGGRRK